MRCRLATLSLPVLLLTVLAAAGPSACGGGGESEQSLGGRVLLRRVVMAPGDGALFGIGTFYAPPGPDEGGEPALGCVTFTPTAAPSASPSPIAWRDAGETISLRSASASLTLDRFPTSEGAIVYLSAVDADPAAAIAESIYDLELAGSAAANGLPGGMIASAIEMPPALALYAPDFTAGSVPLPRTALQIGWDSVDPADVVHLTLAVAGTAGDVTLSCAIADEGVFEVSAAQMAALPAGAGTLSLTRFRETTSRLTPTSSLAGRGEWVESGPFTLP